MSEQQDVIEDLSEVNALTSFRWAYDSAVAKALEDYSEEDGHDATFFGVSRYTLFRDRTDRVFHCGRFAVPSGDADADLDQLLAGLSETDINLMPRIPAGVAIRNDLNGSPGWVIGRYRILFVSAPYGKTKKILWSAKSKTKQRVANQRNPQPEQPMLFEALPEGADIDMAAVQATDTELDLTTFVIVHTADSLTGRTELALGRPRLNSGGGPPWHWLQDLDGFRPMSVGNRVVNTPMPTGPNTVPDAPVRVRREAGEAGGTGSRAS